MLSYFPNPQVSFYCFPSYISHFLPVSLFETFANFILFVVFHWQDAIFQNLSARF